MSYQYDVFISYRRHEAWPKWVAECFLPIFIHWLGEELGRDAKVFCDSNLETGNDWPIELGTKLASSRIIIPLLSRQYFGSDWCKTELALMCAREKQCGFGTTVRPHRLIVPAIIHDGDDLPRVVNSIQAVKLQEFSNAFMTPKSPNMEELSSKIRLWSPDVAKAIKRVPDYDENWVKLAVDEFINLFDFPKPRQNLPPRLDAS
jgi:hypothetical protein